MPKKFNTNTVYRITRCVPEHAVFLRETRETIHVFGQASKTCQVYTFLAGIDFVHYALHLDPKFDCFVKVDQKRPGRFVLDVIDSFKGPTYIDEP